MPTKRFAVAAALSTAVAMTLAACGGGSGGDDEKSLTVTMWGGQAQDAHIKSYFDPWAEEKGVTIKQDSPTDYSKIQTQVTSKKVSWGVVEAEPNFSNTACEKGWLTKLPQEILDKAKSTGVAEEQISECGIPNLQYTFSIAYNTDKFDKSHPTTWEEFFDTSKFPGKRGFWKYATGGIFEAALLADGVEPEDLYPLDIDRAFKKLDTIKKDIVWYDTGDQQTQLVASGEAPLVQAWNGRIVQAAEAGQPVANEYGENLVSYDQVVIPKGYPNTELAQEWMMWFLDNPQAQADDSVASAYGPASAEAVKLVPADKRKDLTGDENVDGKSAATIDYEYWAKNYDEVTEKLNSWIAK